MSKKPKRLSRREVLKILGYTSVALGGLGFLSLCVPRSGKSLKELSIGFDFDSVTIRNSQYNSLQYWQGDFAATEDPILQRIAESVNSVKDNPNIHIFLAD